MKWIGVLILISTTTFIGFDWSNRLMKRPRHIRQFINALQTLEAEMVYSQLPLRDAFTTIARQIPQPAKSFFQGLAEKMLEKDKDFYPIWKQQVEELVEDSSLGRNEKEILHQFGRTLGQHDFYQQQKQIQLAIHHLERELEDARDDQHKYSKLAKSLGILSGLFIVLLLI